MEKIPVGATLAHAFDFAIRRFFAVLGLIWLPWLLGTAVRLVLGNLLSSPIARSASTLPTSLLLLLLMAMQAVGVTRLALGKRGPAFVHLDFGGTVWRVFGMTVVLAIPAIVALVLTALFIARFQPLGLPDGAIVGIMLFLLCAIFYFLMRFCFFLTPVSVSEDRPGIFRSWKLSRKNVWRQLAVCLTILIPAVVALVALEISVGALGDASGATPTALVQARIYQYWYIAYPLGLLASTLFLGATFGAQSFAYRALVPSVSEADAFN